MKERAREAETRLRDRRREEEEVPLVVVVCMPWEAGQEEDQEEQGKKMGMTKK